MANLTTRLISNLRLIIIALLLILLSTFIYNVNSLNSPNLQHEIFTGVAVLGTPSNETKGDLALAPPPDFLTEQLPLGTIDTQSSPTPKKL
ncbi:hypothetical protein EG329_000608 [Mollisiaceae sp. DMI_Dod_QoI]|nr:hypothetical protein EG329_000608 [Helotiales sp. DMI_Dod_QoI]